MSRIAFLLFMISLSSMVNAVDYGKHGNVFIIQEEDARKTFIKSAARVDWEKPRKQIRESIVDLKANDKNTRGLYPPNEDVITFIDPSITAQRDIYAPYIKEGQIERELLVAKGTRINPLDYMEPTVNRLFVNSEDVYQVELVKKLIDEYSVPLQIIVVKGKLEEIRKIAQVGVFQANPSVLDHNQIDFTPSLVTVSRHPNYLKRLQVTSLSRPFDIDRLMELITYE